MSKKRRATTQFDARFLEAMVPSDQHQNVQLRLTNGAMEALQNCQEEFIAQLAECFEQGRTTAAADDTDTEQPKQTFVKPEHLERAMGEMGFLELFQEAQRHQQVQEGKQNARSNKKSKKLPKGKKVSAEMEAEQERLLQLSKQNAMHHQP